MTKSVPPKNDASLRSVLDLFVEGLSTRAQIFGLELSVAKDNTAKSALNMVLAALFGIFRLSLHLSGLIGLSSGMTTEYLLRAVWQAFTR